MLAAYRRTGLGIYVNEAQRSINGLGDVPNDFEAGVDLCYTPVRQGWYYGVPVRTEGRGLGQGSGTTAAAAAAVSANDQAALKGLVRLQRMQTFLQVMATLSITTLATLAVVQGIKDRRAGARLRVGEE